MGATAAREEYVPMKTGFPVEDVQLRKSQTFPRYTNLKDTGVDLELTLEQEIEYMKCAQDPVYFAKNYYKITSIDKGFILFDPFPYQEELLNAFHDHRFTIDVQCRQSGKCVRGDTTVVVRELGARETEIEIESLHNLFKDRTNISESINASPNFGNLPERKFLESFLVDSYEVLTDSGWHKIVATNKTVEYDEWKLVTEEGEELHAADDHIVFLESGEQIFVKNLRLGDKIITERGLSTVKEIGATGKSLNMFDLQVDSEEHRYYTNGILSHNTTVVGAFLTWFILFNDHKEVFVLANKEKQALEILTRIRKAILDLPFFLMRGVVKFGVGEVEFDNGSKAVAYATSSDSIRGRSAALLYIDEVAFIENDMEFWESTYPAIAQSETSRVIMTSTPKGQRGLLYKTWKEAEPDEKGNSNGFHRIMVKWNDVPPYCKDPDWKEKQIKRLGEPRFKQEFECNFKGSVGTLIGSATIEQMISTNPDKEPDEWTKVYHDYDEKRKYVAVVDVGGGTGNDYSVCRIMDVTEIPYRTAALYRNNEIDPLLFPHIVKFLCEEYGECWVLPERNNDMGGEFTSVLTRDLEYEYVLKTGTKDDGGSGTVIGGSNKRAGIRTNVKTKAVGCSNLKSMIERGVIVVDDLETIDEIGNFIAKKDSYEADEGCNDDCVMTLVIFAWLAKQRWFTEEFESGVMNHLTEHAKGDGTLGRAEAYAAMVGGVNSADVDEEPHEYYNGIPVVSNSDDFFNDMPQGEVDDGMFSGFN